MMQGHGSPDSRREKDEMSSEATLHYLRAKTDINSKLRPSNTQHEECNSRLQLNQGGVSSSFDLALSSLVL